MASSLIFAALVAAWLIVLVPIFARRRQEVSRTTDAALAARVVRRGSDRPPAGAEAAATDRAREEHAMPEHDRQRAGGNDVDDRYDDRYDDGARYDAEPDGDHDDEARPVHSDDVRAGRRYRPGRGGFDPEAAALAARAKYARRQRTVLVLLLVAITTAVLAALVTSSLWWVHALVDLTLVGFLVYLRQQVRIESEVRERRLARLSGDRGAEHAGDRDWDGSWDDRGEWDDREWDDREWDGDAEYGWDEDPDDVRELDTRQRGGGEHADRDHGSRDQGGREPGGREFGGRDSGSRDFGGRDFGGRTPAGREAEDGSDRHREPHIPASANAVALDIDDEDPDFDELDERLWQPYRRASGE